MSVPKQGPVVAVDGPAGTGKSSATKLLAAKLGYVYVDTGALYRSVAYLCIKSGVPLDSNEKVGEVARTANIEFLRDQEKNPSNRVIANGTDVTDLIRTMEVSMAASTVSSFPEVRSALLGRQRTLGCRGESILEGRDIGTVIFPDADVKFFLTASVEERAKRRLAEIEATGADVPSFEEIKNQISQRDNQDMTRKVAPLRKAQDAIEIDTTKLTLDEVVSKMLSLIAERIQ